MAVPHYVTVPGGQMKVWRAGQGRSVLALASPAEAAATCARRTAEALPGHAVTVPEWPGIGGSAGLAPTDAAAVAGVAAALGISGSPVVAFDLAGAAAGEIAARTGASATVLVDGAAARAWAARGFTPPDLAPRPDGTHLTALFAHLRDAVVLDPADPLRPRRDGPPLPSPADLDAAAVTAAVDGEAFARLWRILLDGFGDGGVLDGLQGVSTLGEAAAVIAAAAAPLAPPLPATAPGSGLWSDHVDIPAGRVHLRRQGTAARALMVLQSAPGSTAPLVSVIDGLATVRSVVAPDFPGNGDSCKIAGPVDIARLGSMMLDVADALGLATVDLWGTHTGALVALEMALQRPERIGRVVMEAPPLLDAAFSEDILANYLPPLRPDRWGMHLQQAWNMRRDMFLFWPWYRQDRAAGRALGLPGTRFLHDWTVGLLKSGTTYDLSYRAAFEYPTVKRLPLLTRPTLVCAGPTDMLVDGLEAARRLAPEVIKVVPTPATVWYPNQPPGSIPATIAAYRDFLV